MQAITIDLGVIDEKGKVTLNVDGRQFLSALLIHWIKQGERGMDVARAMKHWSKECKIEGQLAYFKNGVSFMGQRLASQVKEKYQLKQELEIVAKWSPDDLLPHGWEEYVNHAESMGDTDGTEQPVEAGSGRDHIGLSGGGAVTRERPAGEPHRKGDRKRGGKGRAKGQLESGRDKKRTRKDHPGGKPISASRKKTVPNRKQHNATPTPTP